MDKLVVVTGGSRGIGKAIVERFARANFKVITCARDAAALETLKQQVLLNDRTEIITFQADVSIKEQADAFANYVQSLKIPIEVLINNAGYFLPQSILEGEEDSLEKMLRTNLYSAYYISRKLIPIMKLRRKGHIFNICSVASITAYASGGAYTVSKFALLGFSKVLREDLKPFGVRVTAVLPGATKTASWDGVDLPEDRLMKTTDIADTVFSAYMLSQNSVVEEILIRPQLGDI